MTTLSEQHDTSAPTNSVIESIGVYLPETEVTTDEIVRGCDKPLRFPLEEFTGIASRRMAGQHEFSIDLARKAVADCLSHSRHAPGDIDLVICAHISRYDGPRTVSYEPSTAMVLKREFGFSRALAFDVTNACAGMFTAIAVVHDLIRTGRIRRGLIASGEYITHLTTTAQQQIDGYMDPQLASLTLGDAGAAVILEAAPSDDVGFHAIDLYTLAEYSPLCVAKSAGGSGGIAAMTTDSIRATAAVIEHSTKLAAHVLRQSPRPLESFQHVIPHQTSRTSIHEGLSEVARLFKRNLEALVINNVARRGNTASNTHFVAVRDNIENNTIQSGDSAMFCFSGSGITVGTALYTFDDLPDRLAQAACGGNGNGRGSPKTMAVGTPEPVFVRFDRSERIRIESIGTCLAGDNGTPRKTQAMVARAGKACLRESVHRRRDVGLLVHVGIYRSEFIAEPTIAALAASELKINLGSEPADENRTLTFDLMNGAAGFLDACCLAAGMIRGGRFETAMILASEVENNVDVGVPQRRGLTEAASAVLLDRGPRGAAGFRSMLFKDYPELVDACRARAVSDGGATRLVFDIADDLVDHYVACIAESVEELFKREGIQQQQIAIVLPPQMGGPFIDHLARVVGIERSKFLNTGHGDLFTSSVPFAIRQARAEGRVHPGELALILTVGSGVHVGCAVYQF